MSHLSAGWGDWGAGGGVRVVAALGGSGAALRRAFG